MLVCQSRLWLKAQSRVEVEGLPVPRKKYTPAFKAECVRQVAAGVRQTDVAVPRASHLALQDRWQRAALE
jgi:transposase